MSKSLLITIGVSEAAGRPAHVLVQSIGDRERHPNGEHLVQPGESREFLVDDFQCLRVSAVEGEEPTSAGAQA
jgi:hypothetical protein